MIVCSCNVVRLTDIVQAIESGNTTVRDIVKCTGAGTDCKICRIAIKKIIKETVKSKP